MRTLLVAMMLLLGATIGWGQQTLLSSTIGLNSAADDTCFYDISKLDWFGVTLASDSDCSADIYFDYRGTASGNGVYATYTLDSLSITTGTTGGQRVVPLRTPLAENIPWGANFMRIRRSPRAAGNGEGAGAGGLDGFYIVIDGIRLRTWRPGE